jgi:hypothetical protein
MKPTLQFDDVLSAYLQYAAMIDGVTVAEFVWTVTGEYQALPASVQAKTSLQKFAEDQIVNTVRAYEWENNIRRRSITYGKSARAHHRAWDNMLANRAALVGA